MSTLSNKNGKQRQKLGAEGERLAQQFLRREGYVIRQLNYRVRFGEIDIIADDDGVLVFVEVKSRTSSRFGSPAEAVTLQKQKKLLRVAECFMVENNLNDVCCRFDVVAVSFGEQGKPEIEVIKNAFEQ